MDGVETGPYEIGNKVTDTGGNFDIAGTQVAKLTGPYVEMRDLCGWGEVDGSRQYAIATLIQANGIDWGGGTDCTTHWGFSGPANTHSSRSGIYEVTVLYSVIVFTLT